MLYLIVMSFFLCVVIWDTERVGRRKGECCGLFMCKLKSICCCKGFFLSPKQIRYGDKDTEMVPEPATNDGLELSSKTEKFIDKIFAPAVLSKFGRIGFLVIYVVLIAGSIYGMSKVRIDFKVTYFIGETA